MNISEKIAKILQEEAGTLPSDIAKKFNESELTIIRHLPEGMAIEIPADQFQFVLQQVKKWGMVTTIIEVAGSIFEIKTAFPEGTNKFGYYNLMTKDNPFQGHLKAENIAAIVLISKLFHGVMTHSINFLDTSGKGVFKIYLGRNSDRTFIEGQEKAFETLKKLAINKKNLE